MTPAPLFVHLCLFFYFAEAVAHKPGRTDHPGRELQGKTVVSLGLRTLCESEAFELFKLIIQTQSRFKSRPQFENLSNPGGKKARFATVPMKDSAKINRRTISHELMKSDKTER